MIRPRGSRGYTLINESSMTAKGVEIPGFVARGHGTLINISSAAALAPQRLNGLQATSFYVAPKVLARLLKDFD
jgi:short-subunit dehydrogenase